MAVLISVIAALWTGGSYFYNWYQEPNLINGKYFESAWIEYGEDNNTLSILHIPDGTGRKTFLAIHEAVKRVEEKSWLNHKIDSKPLKVNVYILNGVDSVLGGTFVVPSDLLHIMVSGSREERIENLELVLAYSNAVDISDEGTYTVIYANGTVGCINSSDHYKYWENTEGIMKVYECDTLQDAIDAL
jgi:hypothetical protein